MPDQRFPTVRYFAGRLRMRLRSTLTRAVSGVHDAATRRHVESVAIPPEKVAHSMPARFRNTYYSDGRVRVALQRRESSWLGGSWSTKFDATADETEKDELVAAALRWAAPR
jgi:hypothetical protein